MITANITNDLMVIYHKSYLIKIVMQGNLRVKVVDSDVGFGQNLLPRVITFDSDVGFG